MMEAPRIALASTMRLAMDVSMVWVFMVFERLNLPVIVHVIYEKCNQH